MDNEYKFTATEYSQMLGISTSALRKRRLAGKLEGQYVLENKMYLYARPRPNKVAVTGKKPLAVVRKRRRNVPRHQTRYTRTHMQLANDLKQLARIKGVLREEQIEHITPDIFEIAKERHKQKTLEKMKEPFLTESQKVDVQVEGANNRWHREREQRFNDEEKNWKEPLDPKPNWDYWSY